MTTLRLDEIAANFDALERLLDETAGEVTPEIEAWFAEYDLALREKVDGYVIYLRSLEGDAKSFKSVEDELAVKRRRVETRITWLKSRVEWFMQASEREELRGTIYRFKLVKNGGKAPIDVLVDPAVFPEQLQRVTVDVDREKVRGMLTPESPELRSGEVVLARLGQVGQSLRIY